MKAPTDFVEGYGKRWMGLVVFAFVLISVAGSALAQSVAAPKGTPAVPPRKGSVGVATPAGVPAATPTPSKSTAPAPKVSTAPASPGKPPVLKKLIKPETKSAPGLTRPFDPQINALGTNTAPPSGSGKGQASKVKSLFDRANASGGDPGGMGPTAKQSSKKAQVSTKPAVTKMTKKKDSEPKEAQGMTVGTTVDQPPDPSKPAASERQAVPLAVTPVPLMRLENPGNEAQAAPEGPQASLNTAAIEDTLKDEAKKVPIDIIGPMPGKDDDFGVPGGTSVFGGGFGDLSDVFNGTGIKKPGSLLDDMGFGNRRNPFEGKDPFGMGWGNPFDSGIDISPSWGGQTGREIGGWMSTAGGYLGGTTGGWLDTAGQMIGAETAGQTAGILGDKVLPGSGGVVNSWVDAADGKGTAADAAAKTADAGATAAAESLGAVVGGAVGGPVGVLVGAVVVALALFAYGAAKDAVTGKDDKNKDTNQDAKANNADSTAKEGTTENTDGKDKDKDKDKKTRARRKQAARTSATRAPADG